METRIKRYFALRRLNQGGSSDLTSMDDESRLERSSKRLDLLTTPSLPRTDARNKQRVKATKSTDSLVLKSSPYESAQAGKPPIVGGAPVKGNGPARLQHNVRLSSGELLVTQQANERTFEEIKRGDYTVGRKNQKQTSEPDKASSLNNVPQPPPLRPPWESEAHSLPHSPFFTNHHGFENSPSSFTSSTENIYDGYIDPFGVPQSSNSSPLGYFRPLGSKPSTQRVSGSGKDNEGNVLIQALWKAEYNQLVSIQHQKYNVNPRPSPRFEDDCRPSSRDVPYIEGHCSPDIQAYYHTSNDRELALADQISTHSYPAEASGASSNRTDSTYTGRTSFQPDQAGTRDDVRRMIEDMRTMYLSAIESRSTTSSRSSIDQDFTTRASVGSTPTPHVQATRLHQKSWHAGSTTSTTPRPKPRRKRKPPPPKTNNNSTFFADSPLSPQTSYPQTSLTRADSMTLGSLLRVPPKPIDTSPPTMSETMAPDRSRLHAVDVGAGSQHADNVI